LRYQHGASPRLAPFLFPARRTGGASFDAPSGMPVLARANRLAQAACAGVWPDAGAWTATVGKRIKAHTLPA
jgi:hypothetical protein